MKKKKKKETSDSFNRIRANTSRTKEAANSKCQRTVKGRRGKKLNTKEGGNVTEGVTRKKRRGVRVFIAPSIIPCTVARVKEKKKKKERKKEKGEEKG